MHHAETHQSQGSTNAAPEKNSPREALLIDFIRRPIAFGLHRWKRKM
jgi:hypothetical protein